MAPSSSPDYIIVGGGTSGLVVANRLFENPHAQVLVLEAGQDLSTDPRINIPALFTTLMGSDADWQYKSVPQSALKDRTIREPQGKTLGGSSASTVKLSLPLPSNPGWDWAGLVPSYKKAYTLIPPSGQATRDHLGLDWISDEYRGTSGSVKISFPGVIQNPLAKAWIDTFRGLNKVTTSDPFSGNSVGAYSNAATVDPENKVRSYADSAYGAPARQRSNVQILTEAQVQRILFAETVAGPVKATGVEALLDVAAGVFNTPKLLELSGVGNKNLLERHSIRAHVDLPGVGENFQDHLMTGLSYEVVGGVITGDPLMRQEPEALAMAQKLYVEHKAGPFTMGGMQSHSFVDIPNVTELLDSFPQSEGPNDAGYYKVVRSILESSDSTSAAWFMFLAQANLHEGGASFVGTKLLPGNFASLGCIQARPFSRGSTHISSADAEAAPVIDPRYFSHPADSEIMGRHVQSPDGQRNHPDALKVGDLDVAKQYILDTETTSYHGCGTAAMRPGEKGGVVNPKLVVYGTENLRVVDASIFPLIPRGNIMPSVYAVAKKAADIIKGDS